MKQNLLSLFAGLVLSPLVCAQSVSVFNNVPFYSMYHYLGAGETMPPEAYSEIPAGAIRLHAYERDIISRKLTDTEIASLGNSLTMNITLGAACDNYDRIAGVNLALVPKGSTSYTWEQTDVKRIEIARFITPFMNKNKTPSQVPYSYKIDNIAGILHNPTLLSTYDIWIEFRADGYSASANTQVPGCADRTDVFRGTLELTSSGTATPTPNFFLPLSYRQNLNNYNATDVPGATTRIIQFTLDQPVDNAVLYLISSNHGANTGGEEYNRREHYVYLDNQLVHQYKPGGKSCEDYRQYNTQNNGIYGTTAKTLRNWMSFNNWCPGDAVPNREVKLGNLAAGNHSIKINVPDAVFANEEGYFPISMYIQNQGSGQIICATPTNLSIVNQQGTTIKVDWKEASNSTNWELLWARKGVYATANDNYLNVDTMPTTTLTNLTNNWYYEMYVRSKCTNEMGSLWAGPVFSERVLATHEASTSKMAVYPNPTKNFVNISSEKNIKSIEVYNTAGQKVSVNTKSDNSQINLSGLSSGLYVIKVISDQDEIKTFKITKQ